MSTATKINQWALVDSSALGDSARDAYGRLIDASVYDDLVPVLQSVREQVEEINRDGRLTTEGKTAAIRLAGAKAHDRLETLLSARRRKLELDAGQVKAPRLETESQYAERIGLPLEVVTARMHELRCALAKLDDPVIQKTTLAEAAQQGDVAVLIAASGWHPLVSPVRRKDVEEAIVEYVNAHTPAEALSVQEAMQTYDGNGKTAATHIGALTGVQAANTHARAAAKRASRPPMFDEGRDADRDSRLP